MADDIQSAFAGGDFELGDSPAPQSQPETPASERESTEARDATPATPAKDTVDAKPKAHARDEQDEDEDSHDEGPPSLDGLQKALKSERSLKKQQRKELKDALIRLQQIEQHNQQMMAHLRQQEEARHKQQQTPKPEEKKPDDWDELLTKGPEFVRATIREEFAQRERQAEAIRQQEQVRRLQKNRAEVLQRYPEDGEAMLREFGEMARKDPRLEQLALGAEDPGEYAVKYAREATRIAKYGSIDELVDAEIARRESERQQPAGSAARGAQGERRAPLTLAGRRGSGAGVTPAQQNRTLDQIMTF